MTDRMQRIDQLLRKELALLLQEDAEALGIVDIVDLRTNRDLSTAQVFLASLSQRPQSELLAEIEARAGGYGRVLGRRLRLKRIPHFEFTFDTEAETIERVESLLDQIASSPPRSQR